MDKMLYFQCFSGISGDMFVASLIDLGVDVQAMKKVLASLGIENEFEIKISKVVNHGIAASDFNVLLHHDHHDHDHDHDHDGSHHHEHRSLSDILPLLENSALSPNAMAIAVRTFNIIAEAEAKAHACSVENVHFHEVGAVDSIVDIAAAAFAVDSLGIDKISFSELSEGSGTVMCQHGELPVPVPAVVNIALAHSVPIRFIPVEGEHVTPTGIALAAALSNSSAPDGSYRILKTGFGAGKREFASGANVLRAMVLEKNNNVSADSVLVLETNIDDSTGEELGAIMNKLMGSGALDVFFTPVFAKKNRPAYMLSVICRECDRACMEELIFRNSSTIGIRSHLCSRSVLPRDIVEVATEYGNVAVKRCVFNGETFCYPEFESVMSAAERGGMKFDSLYARVKSEAEKTLQ